MPDLNSWVKNKGTNGEGYGAYMGVGKASSCLPKMIMPSVPFCSGAPWLACCVPCSWHMKAAIRGLGLLSGQRPPARKAFFCNITHLHQFSEAPSPFPIPPESPRFSLVIPLYPVCLSLILAPAILVDCVFPFFLLTEPHQVARFSFFPCYMTRLSHSYLPHPWSPWSHLWWLPQPHHLNSISVAEVDVGKVQSLSGSLPPCQGISCHLFPSVLLGQAVDPGAADPGLHLLSCSSIP